MPKSADMLPMPIAYFQLMLREFGKTPALEAALREGTGVAVVDPGEEITVGQQFRQLRNANRILPSGWALYAAALPDAAAHGPLAFAALSAPTLADSVAVITRFVQVRTPYFRLEARRDSRWLTLRVKERVELVDAERVPLLEVLILSIQSLVERVIGRPMREATLDLVYPRPTYADLYPCHFHMPVRFDADHAALALPASWLPLTCPLSDPSMYEASVRKLESLARRLEGDDYLMARVEQMIATSRDGVPSLAEVAERLQVSSRTLGRRIQRAGTTFGDLLDGNRRERAEALLRDRNFSIAEVGYSLGYGDSANFARACRRWFGMAPREYRRHLLGT